MRCPQARCVFSVERLSPSCHGSFGELLQGALPELGHFHVTLPVELHARARFNVHDSLQELRVQPESSWKSRRLVEALLRRVELPLRGELTLDSEIPRGKGLASSIGGSRRCLSCGRQLSQLAV